MNELLAYIPYCGAPPLPAEIWSRWNFDPALIAVLLILFVWHALETGGFAGAARSRGFPRASSTPQRVAFYGGWVALAIGLLSPICALSVSLFSARVSQHMWLIVVAAPLLALSGAHASNENRRAWSLAPFTAAGLFAVVLWGWHWPQLYAFTFTSEVAYWVMHISMTGAAVLLWRSLLAPSQEQALARVAAGFVTLTHMGLLGALIAFAPRALYAPHYLTASAWNLTALEDQQLGGLIMWIPASAVFLAVALLTALSVLRESEPAKRAPL